MPECSVDTSDGIIHPSTKKELMGWSVSSRLSSNNLGPGLTHIIFCQCQIQSNSCTVKRSICLDVQSALSKLLEERGILSKQHQVCCLQEHRLLGWGCSIFCHCSSVYRNCFHSIFTPVPHFSGFPGKLQIFHSHPSPPNIELLLPSISNQGEWGERELLKYPVAQK